MIKAVLFDLDGTLLPMDEEKFTNVYFSLLCKKVGSLGYEKNQLINTILTGTKLMYENNGSKTNEEVFWDYFISIYGEEKLKDKEVFNDFYINEFRQIKEICEGNPLAKEIVKYAKDNFPYVILATNPIFPLEGTKTRMSFVSLVEKDFDFITAYENFSYCKPNKMYFLKILEQFNLKPDEVIFFGNNTIEDKVCAESVNIRTYLVGDYIINKNDYLKNYNVLKMEDVIPTLKLESEKNND